MNGRESGVDGRASGEMLVGVVRMRKGIGREWLDMK